MSAPKKRTTKKATKKRTTKKATKKRSKRYGPKASEKVEETMHALKRGTLRSSTGAKVTSRKQAIAIGLAEARREGGKVPEKNDD